MSCRSLLLNILATAIAASSLVPQSLAANNVSHNPLNYRYYYPLPVGNVPDGWGVNIHFTHPMRGEMDKIQAAGFKWVRMDFFWPDIEKRRGHYNFSDYDLLMRSLDRHHIRPIFILDYGNPIYGPDSPNTTAEVHAFTRFVAASVRHFRDRGIVWEMWNEPNIGFWKPAPDVQQYIRLALAVGKTIRKVAPEEWFIGPATSGFDFSFLESCFQAGLLNYFDGVSVHPYRNTYPETVTKDWVKLRNMIQEYQPAGKYIYLISGEWGYSTSNKSWMTQDRQADYAVRQYLANLSCGAFLSIWYDWTNDGNDPTNNEDHFGLTQPDFSPKPAYLAVQKVAHHLAGYRALILVTRPHSKTVISYIEMFQKVGKTANTPPSSNNSVFYAWTSGTASRTVSYYGSQPFEITSMPKQVPINFNGFLRKYGGTILESGG